MRRSFSESNVPNIFVNEHKISYRTDLVSQESFNNHLALYRNYINNVNDRIDHLTLDTYDVNGVVLHQLFFENIGRINSFNSEFIDNFFDSNFGGFNSWKSAFHNLCMDTKPAGWCAIVFDLTTKRYKNIKIISHDHRIPYGCKIIYLIDMFEHSYCMDYGINKAKYIDMALQCIEWNVIINRIEGCIYA